MFQRTGDDVQPIGAAEQSFVRLIATYVQRKFVAVSLGNVREIRGNEVESASGDRPEEIALQERHVRQGKFF